MRFSSRINIASMSDFDFFSSSFFVPLVEMNGCLLRHPFQLLSRIKRACREAKVWGCFDRLVLFSDFENGVLVFYLFVLDGTIVE